MKKHFFLVTAVAAVVLMGAAGGLKLVAGKPKDSGGAAAGGAASASGHGKGGKSGGGRPAPVTVVAVEPRAFTDTFGAIGVAKARQSVTLTSATTELVTSVRFTSGQSVKEGEVLANLKSDAQQADVNSARVALDKAKSDYDRWSELDRRGFAPKAQVEQYRTAWEQAKATLDSAQSRLRDRVIKAPFAGTIGLSDAAAGMLITPGTPIATLDDLSVMRVDFDIPERYLAAIGVGTAMTATSDAFQGEPIRGTIAKIDTRVKPDTRSVTARAEFPNPGGRIKPGMLLKVAVSQGARTASAVPEAAVQFSADQPFVFVVTERDGHTVAEQRTVLAGAREGGFVEIREGLNPGERIVADGLNRLQSGQALKVLGAGGEGEGHGRHGPRGAAPQAGAST